MTAIGTFRSTALMILIVFPAGAQWIPTNEGNGADAEVRESAPTQNRGASTEIATRVKNDFISGDANDGNDRNSAIYTRFDLSNVIAPSDLVSAFRLTYRNNNLVSSRVEDTVTPNPAIRTGLAVYGLDPAADVREWDESTITYLNAPGITSDGDVGTRDFNSDLIFLGTVAFPELGNQNHLPVGGEIIFRSGLLNQIVSQALTNQERMLTLVTVVFHSGDGPLPNWLNFNYLFNPKEQTTLNLDPSYDPDVTSTNDPLGSPFSGADNSDGRFSPALLIQAAAQPATITAITVDSNQVELTISNATPRIVSNTVERAESLLPAAWTAVDAYLSSPGLTNWSEPLSPGLNKAHYRIKTE